VKATIEEIWGNRSLLRGHDGLDPQVGWVEYLLVI
jgi:hypothetical protein